MPIFRLGAVVGVSAYTNVEADTYEDAVAEAETRDVQLAGGGNDPDEMWIIEDADGTPQDIHDADADV